MADNEKNGMVNEIQERLLDQVVPMLEQGTNGEIKIFRSQAEADLAHKRMIEDVQRRLERDPLLMELVQLEIQYRLAEAKGKLGEGADEVAIEAKAVETFKEEHPA